jgi:hypothetical protein
MREMMKRLSIVIAALALVVTALAVPSSLAAMQAANPGLTVSSPAPGVVIQGDSVTVDFDVSNFRVVPSTVPLAEAGKHPEVNRPGEGHLHLVLDLTPVVVVDKDEAYTFTNVPAGEHRLMVELAENDHASLSPRVVREITFQVAPSMPRTGAGGGLGLLAGTTAGLIMAALGLAAALLGLAARRKKRA